MIQLRLSLKDGDQGQEFEIVEGELLSDAIKRIGKDIPPVPNQELHDILNVVVNGHMIEKDFWDKVKLLEKDNVIVTPKVLGGSSGQLFKQALLIVITVVASVYFPPAAGLANAFIVAGITIAASLALNALIPPPVPEVGGIGGVGDIDNSQMYAIGGQSNQMKRLGIVPKVYGTHRLFPPLAVTPYTELAVSAGTYSHKQIGNISYLARKIGTQGNDIVVNYVSGGIVGGETVGVSGKTITVTYVPGGSTAQQIYNKLIASAAAKALISPALVGDPTTVQPALGSNQLFGGEDAGETVQYFYAIYDFGLGTPQVTELKIGDTPLTTDSFEDFNYRFVDLNKPPADEDDFDTLLNDDFLYYRSQRTTTQLSQGLVDGEENIQNTDENPEGDPNEFILDFICPRGLFGYSASGKTGDRNIKLEIYFALVGTDDWRAYNDLTYVDSFNWVGGDDVTEFNQYIEPNAAVLGTYYQLIFYDYGSSSNTTNTTISYYLKRNQKKLLVPEDDRWEVGAKVFAGKDLLGVIQTITDLTDGTYEITLDRNITKNIQAFTKSGHRPYNATAEYGGAYNVLSLRSSRHEQGAAVIRGSRQAAVYANVRFSPKVAGQYRVRVKRAETFGDYTSQIGDDLTWGAITTTLKAPPIETTKRHVFMELRIKATNQLNGNIQNLSGLVSSVLRYYEPINDNWPRKVTDNPAWVLADLLSGEVNKRALSLSRLDTASLLEWAEYCEEVPTPPPGQEYLEPRFRCSFILDYDTTLQGVVGQVAGAAQASLNIVGGKYGVLIDRLRTTPVQIFTPRNSKDFASQRVYAPQPHGVRVKYIDPNLAWEIGEVVVYDNGYDENNATEFDDLTSFACTNHEQAWRFGRYMIAQNRLRQETISIVVDFENLICTRGDYVQLTQDVMRVGGTPARVKEVAGDVITIDDALDINPDISYGYTFRSTATGGIDTSTLTPLTARTFQVAGEIPAVGDLIVIGEVGKLVFDCIVKSINPNDDMSAQLTLVEKADEIFDYESSSTLPDYDPQLSNTSRPDWYPPKPVQNLTLGDNFWECSPTQSGYNYYAEIVWEYPPGSVFEWFEVWANDGTGYKLAIQTTSKLYKYNVDHARLGVQHGLKVVAVSASGKKLQLIEMPEVTFTPVAKNTPPSDVAGLNMSITNQVVQLSWPSIPDCDVNEYQLRFSPDSNDTWEASIPLQTVSRNVNSVSFQARTGIYFIKAIDFNGNQSANSTEALTTIPNLFDLNVIESLNDAPDFDGTLEQTEKFGEAVVLQREIIGTIDTTEFYDEGFYVSENLLDVGDVYTCRLQSQIRADGYKYGELMSDWEHLADVEHLNSATSDDWDVEVEYRATDVFAAMSDWVSLDTVDHINYGAGIGFTDWRPIPTTGDATGRIFQFRVKLTSIADNVSPRLFDATIKVDMPDRTDSFENLTSHASEATIVSYEQVFKGPGSTPNVQVSIDNAESGDYWSFDYKTLEGFAIRFYDKTDTQVVRQFDVVAKGYGRRHTNTI